MIQIAHSGRMRAQLFNLPFSSLCAASSCASTCAGSVRVSFSQYDQQSTSLKAHALVVLHELDATRCIAAVLSRGGQVASTQGERRAAWDSDHQHNAPPVSADQRVGPGRGARHQGCRTPQDLARTTRAWAQVEQPPQALNPLQAAPCFSASARSPFVWCSG